MSEDPTSLASAYLDGELTADERASVEADGTLYAEVARLRTVRALLYERQQVSISIREQHLANALDAWDRLPSHERTGALRDATPPGVDGGAAAGVAALSSPTPTKRRGTNSTTWLGLAAAGLVVVMGAGLVVRSVTNTDDTDSEATRSNATADADSSADDATGADVAPAQESEAGSEADSEAGQAASAEALPALAAESGIDSDVDVAAPPSEVGELERLTGPDDLAVFASNALDAPSADELPEDATVVTAQFDDEPAATALRELPLCGTADQVVGLADYNGVEVVVGIDNDRALALASLETDCSEVARASLR